MIKVRCSNPTCGRSYSIRQTHLGRDVVCKVCGQRFTLSTSDRGTLPPPPPKDTPRASGDTDPGTVPERLGRFEIRSRLGVGAFGTVYRAHDPTLDREVALKVPHHGTFQTDEDKARFLREPKAAAQLRHPNIVPVYEAGVDGDTYYIASAFIEGHTLQDAIDGGGFDFHRTAKIVMDLALALDYAHHHGVVHRDVKPANIMLDAGGDPLLMDFGLARFEEQDSKLTQDGTLLGTPAYMAPEQASSRHDLVGPASDQYALGVMLYELLSGKAPFSGPPALVILLVVKQEPASPRSSNPKIPKDLETICLKAMSKGRAQRYGSCAELAEDLRRWQEGEPIHARQIGPVERLWRWCRRNPVVAGLSAAAALLLLLVAVVATVGYLRTSSALAVADAERQRAKTAHEQEVVQRQQAEAEEERADRNAEKERQARARTEKERSRAEYHLYGARIALARQKGLAGEDDAGRVLDECQSRFRRWEWTYLKRLFDPQLRVLRGHTKEVGAVVFSSDGKRLASGDGDGTVRIWDSQTGEGLLTLRGHSEVRNVAFSPDGTRLVAGSVDDTVRIWDSRTGEELLTLGGHRTTTRSAAFSLDGRRLAVGSLDGTVKIWDPQDGKEVVSLKVGSSGVSSAAFSPDSKRLALGDLGGMVQIWDMQTARELLTLEAHTGGVFAVSFSPDGERLASANGDCTVKVWEVQTGRQELETSFSRRHKGGVFSVVFSPDGKWLASGSADDTIKIWDARKGSELTTLRGHVGGVSAVTFSPDGIWVASGGGDGTVRVWDAHSRPAPFRIHAHAGQVRDLAFSPDGRRVASGSGDKTVKIWDAQTGQELLTLRGHSDTVCAAAFTPDGKFLASGSLDCTVRIWDSYTARESRTLRGHTGGICGLAFGPDGRRLATASQDGTARIWETQTRKELHTIRPETGGVFTVAFSPDGKRLATGSGGGQVEIWDANTGQGLIALRGHKEPVMSGVFSPDGKWLATGSGDDTIRIWDVETGKELLTLRGHTKDVCDVVFSSDGNRLASASLDGTLKIWDGRMEQELLTLRSNSAGVYALAFSPDSTKLVSGDADGWLRIWGGTSSRPESVRVGAGMSRRVSGTGRGQVQPSVPGGAKLGEALVGRWRIGMIITASGGACRGIVGYMPVPMQWPEQQVSIVKEDIPPRAKISYQTIDGGAKIMMITIPTVAAGEKAEALVTCEVRRFAILPPDDTSKLQLPDPRAMDNTVRRYLLSSLYIESQHPKILALAGEIGADEDNVWDRVEAIYDWVREKVEYKAGSLKGALAALNDGAGDGEEMSSLFVAICRAGNIPARTVWCPRICYPEFYLVDDKGGGHWLPCQIAGTRAFGGMPDRRPILQKGDSFRPPWKRQEEHRYLAENLSVVHAIGTPQVEFVRELVSQ